MLGEMTNAYKILAETPDGEGTTRETDAYSRLTL
jgi:hypothetical protein